MPKISSFALWHLRLRIYFLIFDWTLIFFMGPCLCGGIGTSFLVICIGGFGIEGMASCSRRAL